MRKTTGLQHGALCPSCVNQRISLLPLLYVNPSRIEADMRSNRTKYMKNETDRVFFNSTIRQTVQVSTDAEHIRLRVSNAFGGSDLPIAAVTIALPESEENGGAGTSAIKAKTLRTLTFSGSKDFTVPMGALAVSDPVRFNVKAESVVTVSMYLAEGQETNEITAHPGSRTTSWFSFGNHVDGRDLTGSTQKVEHWYVYPL